MRSDSEILASLLKEVQALRETLGRTQEPEIDFLGVLLRPEELAAKYPNLGSLSQIRWWLHHRADNGLEEHGAVVKQGKAVWIVIPRFSAWLAGLPPSETDSRLDAKPFKIAPSGAPSSGFSQVFRTERDVHEPG